MGGGDGRRGGNPILRVALALWAAATYAIYWLGYLRIGS
jgi:hypothetical protein